MEGDFSLLYFDSCLGYMTFLDGIGNVDYDWR